MSTTEQPSSVNTEDTPPERSPNIVTSETQPDDAQDPKAAAPADETTDEGAQTTDDSAPPEPEKKPRGKRNRPMERLVKRLNKQLAELRANSDASAAEIRELRQEIASLKSGKPSGKPAPKIEDFDTPEQYAEAYQEYKASTADPKPAKKPAKDGGESPKPPAAGPDEEALSAFHAKGAEKLGDSFREAIENPDEVAVNRVMGDFILDSDLGPELYVYLFENPDESRAIYNKKPVEVVKRMQALEAQLAKGSSKDGADPEPEPKPKPKPGSSRASKAPPAPPASDRGSPTPEIDLEDADMDTYAAARKAQNNRSGPNF